MKVGGTIDQRCRDIKSQVNLDHLAQTDLLKPSERSMMGKELATWISEIGISILGSLLGSATDPLCDHEKIFHLSMPVFLSI